MSSGKSYIEKLMANGGMSAYDKQVEKATNPGKAYIENNISEFSKNKSNKTPLMSKSAEKPSLAQAIPFVAEQTAKSDNMFKQAEDVHNKAYADEGQAFSKYGNSEAFRASLIDNDANYKLGDADEESKKVYTNTVSSLYTESFLRELSENPTIENYNKFVNAYNTKPFAKAKIGDMDALDFANSIMYAGNSEFRNRKINTEIEKYNDEIKKNEKEIEAQEKLKSEYDEKGGNWFNDAVDTVVQLGAFVGARDAADEATERIKNRSKNENRAKETQNVINALEKEKSYNEKMRDAVESALRTTYNVTSSKDFEEVLNSNQNRMVVSANSDVFDINGIGRTGREIINNTEFDTKYGGANSDGLTKEQVDVFNYLLAKEGKDSAQKYLDDLEILTSDVAFQKQYAKIKDNKFFGGISQVNQGLTNVLSAPVRAVKSVVSDYNEYEIKPVGEKISDAYIQDAGTLGRISYGLLRSGTELAPSMLLGGMGFAKAGKLLFSTNVYANSFKEAKEKGYGKGKAIIYGLSNAVIENALESMGGQKIGDDIFKVASSKVDDALRNSTKLKFIGYQFETLAKTMGEEAFEEYAAETIAPILKNALFGEKNKFTLMSKEQIESSISGALLGGLLSTAGAIPRVSNVLKNDYNFDKSVYLSMDDSKAIGLYMDRITDNMITYSLSKKIDGFDTKTQEEKNALILKERQNMRKRISASEAKEALSEEYRLSAVVSLYEEAAKDGVSMEETAKLAKKKGIDTKGFEEFAKEAYKIGQAEALTKDIDTDILISKVTNENPEIVNAITPILSQSTSEILDTLGEQFPTISREDAFKLVTSIKNKQFYNRLPTHLTNEDKAQEIVKYIESENKKEDLYNANKSYVDLVDVLNREGDNKLVVATDAISNSIVNAIKSKINAEAPIENINKTINDALTEKSFNKLSFIASIANTYTEALKNKNANVYLAVANSGIDVPSALVYYNTSGVIPSGVNANAFAILGNSFNSIAELALMQTEAARTALANDVADSASEGENGAGEAENAPVEEVVSWSEEDIKDISTEEREKTQKILEGMGYNGEREYNRIMKAVNKSPNKSTKVFDAFRTAFAYLYEHGYKNKAFDPAKVKILGVKNIERIFNAGAKDKTAKQAVKRKDKGVVIKDAAYKAAKLSKREAKMLDGIAAITGRDIRFDATLPGNAKIDLNTGEIVISTTANTGSAWAMIHEVFHAMSVSVPGEARLLKNTILNIVRKNGRSFDTLLKKYADLYGVKLLDENGELIDDANQYVSEEVVCDLLGYVISRPDILSTITGEQRNVIQRFIDRLVSYFTSKDILDKLELSDETKSAFLEVRKEAKAIAEMFRKALEAEKMQAEAMPEVKEAEKKTFTEDGVKLTSNLSPTDNPDVRWSKDLSGKENDFSLDKSAEETRDLVAFHNINEQKLLDALNRGALLMPSIAVSNIGMTDFGDISMVFEKDTINPETNASNKLYGSDAWTPTQVSMKMNPKFDNKKVSAVINVIKKTLGDNQAQLFDFNVDTFEKAIEQADGSVYHAFAENLGIQAAYSLNKGYIQKIPTNKDGTVDTDALRDDIEANLNKDEVWRAYKIWLENISNTVITSYDKATNEEILRNMKAQPDSAKKFKLSEQGDLTVPSVPYASIQKLKNNKSRLSSEADSMAKDVGADFIAWANGVSQSTGEPTSKIIKAINESFGSRYDATAIAKSFIDKGITIMDTDALSLQALYKSAVELPTRYFEAKPGRAIGFEEVAMIILPSNASKQLRAELDNNNIPYTEYEAGNNDARLEALDSVQNVKFSKDISEHENNERKETIDYIRNLGRMSVNDFSSENIQRLEKFARRYREMGIKSPFFRAWFGDWRANDTNTKINYVDVNSDFIEKNEIPAGDFFNNDTAWTIKTNSDGREETAHKRGKWSDDYHALKDIENMLQKAILLDTVTISHPSNRMGSSAIFVHHLYCPIKLNSTGAKGIAKLYVTESYEGAKKFYLNKIEMSPDTRVSADNGSTRSKSSVSDDTISVADIFEFVKTHDADYEKDSKNPVYFNAKPSSVVVDNNGKPLEVYHGTNKDFSIFESADGTYWFSESYDYAESMAEERGGNIVKPYYLNIKNPYRAKLPEGKFSDPVYEKPIIQKAKAGRHDGVIIETDTDNELVYDKFYVVFNKTQMKSSDENIGTYNGADGNTRFSKDISESLDGKQMSESKIKSLAGRLRRSYRSNFAKDRVISSLSDIYTMLAEQRYEDAKTASQSLAERMLDEVKDDVIVNDAAKDILNDIRGTKVWFNDKQIAEAKHNYGNLWHENFFGKVIVSKEAKTSLDQQWQEWCVKYPDYFKSDVIDANMPIKLIEIIEGLKREKHTVVKPDISDAVIPLATDIYNGVWNSAVRRKLTDEEKASIAELKGAGKGLTSQQKLDLIKAVRQDELKRWGVALGTAENADTGSRMSLSEIIKKVEESFGINITHGSDATVKKEGVSGAYNYDSKTVRTKLRNDLPSIAHAIGYHIDNKLKLIDDIIDQTQAVRVQNGDGEGIYETELKRLAGDFTTSKGSREMIREGFAEFIRTYLASKPLAMEAAGNFYSYFESKLKEDEKLLNAVNEAADTIGKYFAQGYEERAGAAIITQKEWEKLNKPKGKEKLNVIRNGINKWLFDRFYGIKQAEKNNEMFDLTTSDNAWVKATLSLNSRARASRILDNGFFDSNGNRVGEGFYEIIKDLGDTESTKFKAFSEYLGYVHALEWVAPNKVVIDGKNLTATRKPVFADAHLNDPEVLKGLIAKAEKNNPDFKPTAERLYKYQDNLMEYYLIPSGAMSKEQADKFRKQYPHYVPFNRFNTVLGGGKPKTNVFANLSNPIKLATGGSAEIRNPIESIINSTFAAVDFKAKNDTMLSLINEFTNGVFPGTMERIYSTKELEKLEEKGKNPFAMEEDARLNESKDASYSPVIDKDKGIVYAWVNGEKRFYQIYDKELYNAVANLEVKNLGALFRFLNIIGNAMKTTMTMKNPLFSLGNFYRDFMTFHYNSTADVNLISHLAMYIGAFKSMIIKDQYYQRYKALGGMDTGRFLADLDAISRSATLKKLNTKKWRDVHSVKDAYKKFTKNQNIIKYLLLDVLFEKAFALNDALEAAPRLAEFKYTMKETSDPQLAMFRANDVTTNFARSGIAGRHLNSIFLFSNASLQGFDKMVRTYTDAKYVKKDEDGNFDKNRLAKVIIKNVTWSVILAALQSFLNRRDEEAEEAYNNLSEFTKNNYDVFYIGDGKFFKLPKEQNLAIPRTFIQRIMDATQGDGVDWRELGDYMWSALTPGFVPDLSEVYTLDLSGIAHGVLNNTAIGVITDVGFNRDYKDDEIVPSYMSGANYEKYYPYTSSFSVKFAKAMFDASGGTIDVSPIAIDHYMSAGGYYGSLFKKLFPYTDVEEKGKWGSVKENWLDAIGLNTKFVVDNTYSTDILNNFYEGRDLAENKFKIDDSAENKIINAKYKAIGAFISKYNGASKTGTGDQQRLDRRMLLTMLDGYDGSELTEGEKYLIHVLDETQNEDLLKLNYPSNEFKSKQFKVDGKKFKTEVSLGANEYAQMCSEIDEARAKAILLIKSYGFSEEEAAVYIVDAFKAIDKEYKAKYLDLYGKDVKVEVEEKIVSSKDKEKVREEVLGNVIHQETTK